MLLMTDITLDWTHDIRHAVGDLRLFSSQSWSRISTLGSLSAVASLGGRYCKNGHDVF